MDTEKVIFISQDGSKLAGIWHIPQKSTTKAVILAHGITVTKDEDGIFIDLANLLQQDGFAVFRFDFRGHGESEGKSVDMTIAGELSDLDAAVQEVKERGYTEIGLLGASFGGGIAALYTPTHQDTLKALCLWNPCLNYDHIFINPITPWLMRKKEQIEQELNEKGLTTVGSRNFVLGKQLFAEMEQQFPYQSLKHISIPTVIIHGDKDSYVPYEDSKQYVTYLKNGQLITIKEAEHGFHDVKELGDQANQATLAFFQKNL